MPQAICFLCGAEKPAPFVPCKGCHRHPNGLDEQAKSLLLTDQYYTQDNLLEIAKRIQAGETVEFNEETIQEISRAIRDKQSGKSSFFPILYVILILGLFLCSLLCMGASVWLILYNPSGAPGP